jgi:hypothetical protein
MISDDRVIGDGRDAVTQLKIGACASTRQHRVKNN